MDEASEEQFPPYKLRANIQSAASRLTMHEEPAIGIEDTNRQPESMKEDLQELNSLVQQALQQVGEVDARDVVWEWLKERSENFWNKHDGEDNMWSLNDPTVKYPSRGDSCKGFAKEVLNECPYAKRVLVITANDTTDAGSGWLWELDENGNIEKVDEHHGYEGARGRDVEGYFREEHGISGSASWECY